MRKIALTEGEFYHVYNRGTDKRDVFMDESDFNRFLQSLVEFNTLEPIGSIYEHTYLSKTIGCSTSKKERSKEEKLVELIAYCLNLNHFHLLVRPVTSQGLEKFMHRVGTGYTRYFNEKYDRSGSLFQGRFKASHIDSNDYLLHVSAYINLNFRVHQFGGSTSKTSKSSWGEYMGRGESICTKDDILGQFRDAREYERFSLRSLEGVRQRRLDEKDWFHE